MDTRTICLIPHDKKVADLFFQFDSTGRRQTLDDLIHEPIALDVEEPIAAELVKRWNAYQEREENMKQLAALASTLNAHGVIPGATAEQTSQTCKEIVGECYRLLNTADQQADPSAPKPYTVVLRYDDPNADNDRTADDHVFVVDAATSSEEAEKKAIAALVISECGKTPGTQAFEEATRDFTAIAIYAGHLTNLVQ